MISRWVIAIALFVSITLTLLWTTSSQELSIMPATAVLSSNTSQKPVSTMQPVMLVITATAVPVNTEPLPTATAPTPVVFIGAGDISYCGTNGDKRTAELIERLIARYPQAEVFTVGDNVQIVGASDEFRDCFRPAWGRFLSRIHPSPGNHDWYTDQGSPYFTYFGAAAGPAGLGYYSYNLGDWHIVSLNSNCEAEDCGEESAQARWLRSDLGNNDRPCTLLYWHHPLFDTGTVPISLAGQTLWRIASEYNAEVVVNGHDHHYERFAPLNADGEIDSQTGMRPFIVGTGGAWLMALGDPSPISEVRDNSTFGVIVFKLYNDHYNWEFFPIASGAFTDSGSDVCHE